MRADPAPITTTEELARFCAPLATADYVTVDTEFMRETTYWPKVCLIQLAGPDEALRLTEAGRVFRQQVEQETDRLFYAPWQCLEAADRSRMAALLEQLYTGLVG